MHRRLEQFASPELLAIDEQLAVKADAPEDGKTNVNAQGKDVASDQCLGKDQYEQAHHRNRQSDEKVVNIKHLASDQRDLAQFLAPSEVFIKETMGNREGD